MHDTEFNVMGTPPTAGSRVGSYMIESTVGSGGVATVYRAHDADGRVVALKLMHPSRVGDEEMRRFTREYRALSSMDHPNIVRVFEAGVHEGYPWIAMEYVEGRDLDSLVNRWAMERPSDRFAQVERILRGLCQGLAYMHERGFVHRDFKPSNVLVREDGVPKISDLGVVKDSHANTTNLTVAGKLIGTVAFMAPEQITGDTVDARADLYALGAALYVMLASRRPIEASSVAGYLARHLTEVPRPPSEHDPAIPQRLDRICLRLLMKDPTQRYPSARAVLEALDRDETQALPTARGRERELEEWNQRLATLLKGGGGVLALAGPVGCGRSHLLRACLDLARAQGLGAAHASGRDRHLVRRLLAELFEITDPGRPDWQDAQIDRLAAERGTVLAIDDLDRSTPEDVAELGSLVRELVGLQGAPVLLAFTAADLDGLVAPLVEGSLSGLPAEVVRVAPLDRRAIHAILRDRGVPGPIAAVLARRLFDYHHGNAGATLEQVEALLEAGWLVAEADLLRATRPLDEFRSAALPLPARVRDAAERRLAELDAAQRRLLHLLAVIDRPASEELLQHAFGTESLPSPDVLVRCDLLRRTGDAEEDVTEEADKLTFAHPGLAALVRERLDDAERRDLHGEVARLLSRRRRREPTYELAHHLLEAGDAVAAYPILAQAARAASRAGRNAEVFTIVARASAVRAMCEPLLAPVDAARARRQLCTAEGEARLARSEWREAAIALQGALDAAVAEGDASNVSKTKGLLGRAMLRSGEAEEARPFLEAALRDGEATAPERGAVLRALADLDLRGGDLAASELRWDEALNSALHANSRDGESRARRGLAHTRALQNRWDEAARQLDLAEDLLISGGDPRVRAAVLARGAELDLAAGRYAAALRRSELLIELIDQEELPDRATEGWSLLAEVRRTTGDWNGAVDAVRQALQHDRATPHLGARLRCVRTLLDIREPGDASRALPAADGVEFDAIDDTPGQVAALRARLLASETAPKARDLATWVSVRTPPRFSLRYAQLGRDAAISLYAVGQTEAARALTRKLFQALPRNAAEGITLDLLLAMHGGGDHARVRDTAARFVTGIAEALPEPIATAFQERPDIRAVLSAPVR